MGTGFVLYLGELFGDEFGVVAFDTVQFDEIERVALAVALDALLEANVTDVEGMVRFLQKTLLAGGIASVGAVDAGCSAFTAQSEEGKFLYGRNFD